MRKIRTTSYVWSAVAVAAAVTWPEWPREQALKTQNYLKIVMQFAVSFENRFGTVVLL